MLSTGAIKHTELLLYLLLICRPTRPIASHIKSTTQSESVLENESGEDVWTQGKAGDRRLKKTPSREVYAPFALMMIPGWIRRTGHVASMG